HQNVSAHGCNPSPSRRAPHPFMWYLLSPPLGQGTLVRVPYPFGSSEPLRRGPKLLGSHSVLPLPVARRHPLLDRRGTFSPAGVESPDVTPEAPLPELLRAVQQPHQYAPDQRGPRVSGHQCAGCTHGHQVLEVPQLLPALVHPAQVREPPHPDIRSKLVSCTSISFPVLSWTRRPFQ